MLQPCDGSLERSPGPCGRGSTQSVGSGAGSGRAAEIGNNKPANPSARGRGYRRDTIRYQTQTLGAHPDPKIAAPRAASLNSGSPIARRISASRAPRRAPRRPRPRAASAPISQTCARRRRRPPTPHQPYAGRAQAVRRREKKRTSPVIVNTLARKRKRWSPRAARARATRRRPARSAAAASRPTRSRPTRPSAPRGPLGKTSLLKSRRPRRRTPTRPSLGGDVEELTEQEYR